MGPMARLVAGTYLSERTAVAAEGVAGTVSGGRSFEPSTEAAVEAVEPASAWAELKSEPARVQLQGLQRELS